MARLRRRWPYDPLRCYGLLLFASQDDGHEEPLGTCFAFRRPHTFLTAQHCLPSGHADAWVAQERRGAPRRVTAVERHASADIALVTVEPLPDEPAHVFTGVEGKDRLFLGDDVRAYGYTANDPSGESLTTPRFFQGYFQRFSTYTNPAGFSFVAGELNFAAPAGLSGAAVFRPGLFPRVTALVTDNVESATVSAYEETHVGERLVKIVEARNVVSYGIALMLGEIEDWLNDVAPPTEG